ncbi:MAG: DUF2227 family putative metal-binding protein [Candidatus Saccharibacteria bacterium]|nr:DUF2227 family putative metal-binding protein [Candidatus Saccharibacteria bacterium]
MIWIPYQLIFEHRSVFTHGIIIGTVVRTFICVGDTDINNSIKGHRDA